MSYLKSLPADAKLLDALKARPALARPLLEYHEALLRGPSPFSVAERELIAAYVSALNACEYCCGVHKATAELFGVPETLLAELAADMESAGIEPKWKPLLRYVQKLTRTPARMTQADADAVYAAGWDETALQDAVAVCALFNMMNRLVDGLGIKAGSDYFALSAQRLAQVGYAGLASLLEQPQKR